MDIGFEFLRAWPHDGITGIRDEIMPLSILIDIILKFGKRNRYLKYIETLISRSSSFFLGHCILYIFKKVQR